jgi:subtilisin family serine protease
MKTFHVMGSAYSDPYFKLQTGLRNMNLSAAHQIATGRNIKIAVIDTGVDVRHPDLTGQLSPGQNFVEQFPEAPDEVHGTAVAGVIAAVSNNAQGIVGVAPGAKLIALRACWPVGPQKPEAQCDSLTLSLALNGAIKLKPQIINLSLSGPSDPLVERLVNKAMDEGIIVVASSRSGGLAQENFPASIRRVIAVQTATAGEAKLSVDADAIAAPGQEILTTLPNNSYNFMSGSSFAAAHVSGLIALMLELKPGLNAAQIASLLLGSMSSEPTLQALRTVNCCTALASVGTSHCELPINDGQAAKSSIKPMLN